MIYSAAGDNFLRVKLMCEIAGALYRERKRIESQRKPFVPKRWRVHVPGLDTLDARQRENAIVEAILTFTVITLESLTNQALAEKIDNMTLACLAIEYPRQILEKICNNLRDVPELLQKLMILADQDSVPVDIAGFSRNLVTMRNQVVHDKPFFLEIDPDGGGIYLPYKIRGKEEKKPIFEISDLHDIFSQADKVIEYINKIAHVDADFRFCNLFQGIEEKV